MVVIRGGAALYPTASATMVRVSEKGGEVIASDGPYAETKESLAASTCSSAQTSTRRSPGPRRSPPPGAAGRGPTGHGLRAADAGVTAADEDDVPEAYERLILDCLLGDATLFTRADEVDEQWALTDAVKSAWARERTAFPNYQAGTWGPPSADELLERDGRAWRRH